MCHQQEPDDRQGPAVVCDTRKKRSSTTASSRGLFRRNRSDPFGVPGVMSFPDRAASPRRLAHLASFLAGSMLLVACASNFASPPAAAGPTDQPQPTPTSSGAVMLEGVPTACIGLGEADCRRVIAHVTTLLTTDEARVGYVQVGPFGCPGGVGCPTTLAARPEGEIVLESADGALSFHVKVTDGNLDARRQETFAVELPPTSPPQILAGPQPFTLGHCGLFSGIDVGGSWWDPVGIVDYDHGDAINAAEGTIAPVGQDRAVFTSKNGFVVQLVRRNGPKFLPFCD